MCVLYIRNLKQSVKLNEDMEKVQEWCTSNDMVINTMKSKSMIMGSSRKIQYLESVHAFVIYIVFQDSNLWFLPHTVQQ
jgi:hypothetical protein